MTVREIMIQAAEFAGRQDIANYLRNGYADDIESMKKEAAVLLRCFNLTENEVALEYKPLIFEESVYAKDGIISFDSLSRQALDILGIRDEFDNKLPYKMYPQYLKTAPKTVKVSYSFVPEKKTENGESDYKNSVLSLRILAMGTACEFLLVCGLYDDALLWDKRFKDSLLKVCGKSTAKKTMPVRRWYI